MYRVIFFLLASSLLFGAMKDETAHENSHEDTNNVYFMLQNQEINSTNRVDILLLKEYKIFNFANSKLENLDKRER